MIFFKFIGALTNKPYAFTSRPWEINSTDSIDILDVLGSNIRIDSYGSQIKRILPLKNDLINREYISNRIRFFFDGLNKWRLILPMFKEKKDFLFCSWNLIFPFLYLKILQNNLNKKNYSNIGFYINDFVDLNTLLITKLFSNLNGCYIFNPNLKNLNDFYFYFININFFKNLENKKIIFLVGLNLRLETPVLNIRLRNNLLRKNTKYFIFGSNQWDNLNSINVGLGLNNFLKFLQGKHTLCYYVLTLLRKDVKNNFLENCSFLIGKKILKRLDSNNYFFYLKNFMNKNFLNKKNKKDEFFILKKNKKIFNKFNNIHLIYSSLNQILSNELNFFNILKRDTFINIWYLIGLNKKIEKKEKDLVIFQGHNLNLININLIDVFLPTLNFFEKHNLFLNFEGYVQATNVAIYNTTESKSDWIILNSFFIFLMEMIFIHFKIKFVKFFEINRNKDIYYYFQYYKEFLLKKNNKKIKPNIFFIVKNLGDLKLKIR